MTRGAGFEFPQLARVFSGYLHEDFVAEYGSPEAALRAFREDASPAEWRRFQREAKRLVTLSLDRGFDHGYVARPAREGKFPAVIQLQYAGVYALNAGAVARRAAEGWLIINVDSHDKLPSDPSGSVPRGYQAVGNTDRETSYFLNMYLRDSRVLDYLLTRSDWDGKTIILMGGSMSIRSST